MYGTAEPNEIVTIAGLSRRSANGVPYPTTADASGAWRLQLDPYQAGAIFNATITGSVSSNTIEITDIVYGDVILCSGQSNMNKPLSYVLNASAEIKAATYVSVINPQSCSVSLCHLTRCSITCRKTFDSSQFPAPATPTVPRPPAHTAAALRPTGRSGSVKRHGPGSPAGGWTSARRPLSRFRLSAT
jgi:hypothetical protein